MEQTSGRTGTVMARQDTFSVVAAGVIVVVALYCFEGPKPPYGLTVAPDIFAKAQMQSFNNAVEFYRRVTGAYPTTEEGLNVIIHNAQAINFLELDFIPVDPWGRPFLYACPGPKTPYEIKSLGADGKPGGRGEDADIYS